MARPQDPYTPPPMHHDRSGRLVRLVIIAALLGVAFLGYTQFSQQNQTTAQLAPAEQQEVADAGYTTMPEPVTQATPGAPQATSPTTPAPQPAPRSAPAPTPPAEDVPPPSTTIATPPAG